MANRITLRHGSTAPSASNLLPYELGWDQNTLGLYIGQPNNGAPLLISSGGGNVTGVKGNSETTYRTGQVNLTAANIGAATSNHTHTLSLVADTGTSSITLAASSKYKITAGGSTYIFTTPPNTWNALSTSQAGYVAKAPNDTGKFLRGDATWAAVTASNVGLGNVENTKLSTWAGSSNITTLGTISTGTIPWARLSNVPSNFTPASHSHGNIANGGTIASTAVALANGDMLLFSDSSNSGKIERSSITIGTGTSTYLRNDGTWATPTNTWNALSTSQAGYVAQAPNDTNKFLRGDATWAQPSEAALVWGGKNFSGSYGCIDAAMIDDLGANRFAFLKAAGLTIEYSTDGGTTWIDYEASDTAKRGIFGAGQSFYLGKATAKANNTVNNQLKITIATSAAGIYTVLNKIAIYMSTSGNTVQVKIEKALESTPTTFITHLDWTPISGWSGWNILNFSGITTYGNTAASQYGRIVLTFKQTAINSNYPSASISRILGFGGMGWTVPSNLARNGHLYSYDNSQNATFPAQITATQFNGPLNGNATSATKATQDGNGATISSTYLKLSGGTLTGVLTAKGSMYEDSYSGALNMNNSNIYGLNSIYTADSSDNAAEGIHFYRDTTHVDTLWMNGGDLLFVPNRALGTSTTKANSQKVGRFTANPTTDQVVVADGTTGGIKTTGYTIAKSVPSDAVFTDTWNALSTSQAGYVAQAPNDTGKFLRGDATWAAVTATNVGLGNVSNNANLNSTTGAKGDIIYWSAANTPAHLTNTSSTTKKFLSITSQVPSWITLSNSDVGLGNVENTKLSTWTGSSNITTIGTISSGTVPLANVSDADDIKVIEALTGTSGLLKKTAANNWILDTTAYGKGSVTSVRVQATSPITSSTSTAQTTSLNTTISLSDCTPNYVLAGPSSGTTAAAPSYRALVAADIPDHSTDKLDSGTLGIVRGGTGASSFTADCAIISGSTTTSPLTTRGINNKTAAASATTTNGNYLITNNTLYYALPKINNAKTYTSNSTFYAPTAGGTSGYVLIGAGTTSAPTWSQTLAIANGGTGATTVDAARTNLQIKYGTTAPSSAGLVNGDIYFYIQ